MKSEPAWQDTPPLSTRTVSALARIASVLRAGEWQFASRAGLNPTQLDILQLLSRRPEGMRLSWLAEQLAVTPASASDSASSLVSKGWLEKTRAADDGRAIALRLTPAGRELAARIPEASLFAESALTQLPQGQQEALYTSLLGLIRQLQQAERFPELRACMACRYFQPDRHTDAAEPHHCALVDAPLSGALLRLDCPEFESR